MNVLHFTSRDCLKRRVLSRFKYLLAVVIYTVLITKAQNAWSNGNGSLGASYSYSGVGVNYVQASQKLAARYSTPACVNPAPLVISGIPTGATIVKAYLYSITGYTGVMPSNIIDTFVNPASTSNNVPASIVGIGGPKCWGETGNLTCRADVTSYITGNGTYYASSSTGPTATDGFTLIIVYQTFTGLSGSIFIHDGIICMGSSSSSSSSSVTTIPGIFPIYSTGFILASDIQANVSGIPTLTVNGGTPHAIPRNFWNFEITPVVLSTTQTSVSFGLNINSPDCYAWGLAGMFFQFYDTSVEIKDPFNDTALCISDTFSVPFVVTHKFLSSNVFTVQLSDASGSFISPTNIGSLIADTSGTIPCMIPINTVAGTGYRIRIISTTPNRTSADNGKNISINTSGIKPIASCNNPVCEGDTLKLNATNSTNGVIYNWKGPNNYTATGASATLSPVSISSGGNYVVTANYYGCKERDTITVFTNPAPAKPLAGSNTPVCSGNTLNLSAFTTTSGVAYSWTGPGSFTSSLQNPSRTNVTTAAAGDYIVTATITATGCAAKDTETVVVRPTPVVNATNNTPVCEGATVNLFSSATPTGTFAWSGPNSFGSTLQNPTITNASPAASGDYIVAVTLNGCTGKDTTTVTVKPNPITPLTNSNTPVCVGGTISLTAASNAGSSYSWTGPNSFGSTLQNPSRANVVMADAGVYSVIATLNGCVSPAGSTTVVVNPAPFVTIYPTPSDSICQGNTVTFIALPANAGASPAYKWTKNSSPAVLGTSNTLVSSAINNNDIIRCEMTETTKCGTAFKDTSNEVKMTVLPWLAPSVSISSNPTTPLSPNELITFTAIPVNAGNNPKYQWQRNSSDVIGATSAVWATQQLSNNDSISVILTSDYKCPQPKTAGSNSIKVIVLTGVDDVKGNNSISLYPNPNNGTFTIKGNVNSNKEVAIQIVNAVGQLVYETRTLPKNKELDEQVNVQHLASGVYILKIKTEPITYIKFKIE